MLGEVPARFGLKGLSVLSTALMSMLAVSCSGPDVLRVVKLQGTYALPDGFVEEPGAVLTGVVRVTGVGHLSGCNTGSIDPPLSGEAYMDNIEIDQSQKTFRIAITPKMFKWDQDPSFCRNGSMNTGDALVMNVDSISIVAHYWSKRGAPDFSAETHVPGYELESINSELEAGGSARPASVTGLKLKFE